MSIHVIKMPDIGEGIAEVELVAWRVATGERVIEDQVLADVMTDKATVEIPSPVHGTVLALGGVPGQVMAVGGELIRIELDDRVAEAAGQSVSAQEPVMATDQTALPPTPTPTSASGQVKAMSDAAALHVIKQAGAVATASPAVRRRARQLGIGLSEVPASGIDGHVTHEDLDAYVMRSGVAPTSYAGVNAGAHRHAERQDEESLRLIGLRRKIAEKMQESKRHIPHFTYVEECDVTEFETLRAQLNSKWGATRGHLTMLPLLARAIVLALQDYPQCNARFDDQQGVVTRYGAAHIGIATQTEAGLMVPVLRHAEARDPWSSAAEIRRLAAAARAGQAVRAELSGSTITITSLGALGGLVSTPVINYPEVAIVGINRIIERPVIRAGAVVARQMMNLSSSFDHRIIDGQYAASFIQALRTYLETPALLFVD